MAKLEMSKELKEQLRNAEALKKDISTARVIIQNALQQYIKKKNGARNKAQIANQEALFAALNDYPSKREIHDAYGWGIITEEEMCRLMDMWDAREVARENNGKYVDRVTEMLEHAMRVVGDPYMAEIEDAEEARRIFNEEVMRIQRENAERDWQRSHQQHP